MFGKYAFFLLTLLSFIPLAEANETASKLHQVETNLASKKSAAEALRAREENASVSLRHLQEDLVAASDAWQEKQQEAENLAAKLQELEASSESKTQNLLSLQQKLASLAGALAQLRRQPPESLLLQTSVLRDEIHRSLLLRALVPELQKATLQIVAEINDVQQLRQATTEQQRLVAAAEDNLAEQRHNFDQLVQARQGLLQKTAAERAAIAQQLVALTAEAQDLRQLMQKVSQRSAFPQKPPRGNDNSEATPTLGHGLHLPVTGRTLRGYGVRDKDGVLSQGLTLLASAGSPVVAPAAGRVVFVGPFRGYGQIIILAHAGNYHSFLAGFGRIDAEMGQNVAAGEPLGIMPEKAQNISASDSGRPELYFEWRHRGEAIDPALGKTAN